MEETQRKAPTGWHIFALVVLGLTAIDFFFSQYEAPGWLGYTTECGNGMAVLTSSSIAEACKEHVGLVLGRLVVGGGITAGAWLKGESIARWD